VIRLDFHKAATDGKELVFLTILLDLKFAESQRSEQRRMAWQDT
jgi:hypothetical protein